MFAKRFTIALLVLWLCLTPAPTLAAPCSPEWRQALTEAGLSEVQINVICKRAAELKREARPKIDAARVEADIVGKMAGNWIFQRSEWRDIDIVEEEYGDDKAKIVAHVETIRNKSGQLRLRYRWTGDDWKIYRIFNIDFE